PLLRCTALVRAPGRRRHRRVAERARPGAAAARAPRPCEAARCHAPPRGERGRDVPQHVGSPRQSGAAGDGRSHVPLTVISAISSVGLATEPSNTRSFPTATTFL